MRLSLKTTMRAALWVAAAGFANPAAAALIRGSNHPERCISIEDGDVRAGQRLVMRECADLPDQTNWLYDRDSGTLSSAAELEHTYCVGTADSDTRTPPASGAHARSPLPGARPLARRRAATAGSFLVLQECIDPPRWRFTGDTASALYDRPDRSGQFKTGIDQCIQTGRGAGFTLVVGRCTENPVGGDQYWVIEPKRKSKIEPRLDPRVEPKPKR